MPFLSRALKTSWKQDKVIEKIRSMYMNNKRPKIKMAHKKLSEKEVEGTLGVFKHFDRNKDRAWSQGEFEEYLKWSTEYGINHDKFADVFRAVDTDRNKMITVDEFLDYGALRKQPLPPERELEDLFHKYDKNEDGFITLEELRQILLILGEDLSRYPNLRAGFARFDNDKDGLLNLYEYTKFVNTETFRSKNKKKV